MQVSTTDSEVAQAASFAAQQLSLQSNSLSPLEVKEVLSARSKVAAGKVFELKLKLAQGNLPEQIVQVGPLSCRRVPCLLQAGPLSSAGKPHDLSNKDKTGSVMMIGMICENSLPIQIFLLNSGG